MPYNTSAILPREEVTGHSQLPLSRVKKIISVDSDIAMCSNNAAFVIAVATELFIQTLAEQGHNSVKAERKPRRNIQYRDLASAVARVDNLEFLSDVVPQTVTYKAVKEGRLGPNATNARTQPVEAGQTTLDSSKSQRGTNGTGGSSSARSSGFGVEASEDDDSGDPNAQLEMENNGVRSLNGSRSEPLETSNGETIMAVDRILEKDPDVEMT